MAPRSLFLLVVFALLAPGCSSISGSTRTATPAVERTSCDVAEELWIGDWLKAWEFVSDSLLQIDRAELPVLLLYDEACVWTTAAVSAPDAPVTDGPRLFGRLLPWRTTCHGDTLTLPDSSKTPVGLMSYTATSGGGDPFFVMASPGFWERAGVTSDVLGHGPFVTGVFLHEFSHARHVRIFTAVLDSIEATWPYPEEFTSGVVQKRFGTDSAYVAAFKAEFSALLKSAAAGSVTEAKAAVTEALRARRARQDRYFAMDQSVFRTIDDVLTSTEGAAQWAAFAWLRHSEGGGLREEVALEGWGMRGGQVRVGGLALFRAVNRLLPGWASIVFSERMVGATELIERARTHVGEGRRPATANRPTGAY